MAMFTSDVTVDNASIAVTGTFFQATQPVSGTFFQATQPVSGSVSVSNFPATQPVSGTVAITGSVAVTGTFWQATQPISGSVSVSNFPGVASVATVTPIAVSTVVATLSVSNAAKTSVVVYNESGTLFVKLGSAASSTSYSYRLTANSTLEIPGYTGIITAIKQTGSTTALVTEIGI